MSGKPAHIIAAISLALALLFAGTPPDFIHQFADHHDTVHTRHTTGKLTLDQQHHHCRYLSFVLDVFTSHAPTVVHLTPVREYFAAAFFFRGGCTQRRSSAARLRGPPDAC